MIIQCINCNKKFEVNSELIPSKGRNIQCGLCNHLWFFKKTDEYIDDITEKNQNEILSFNEKDNTSEIKDNLETLKKISKNIKKEKKEFELVKYKQKSFSLGKLFSYLIVLIITFVALLIIVDTFKLILFEIFPNLELVILNLFEVFKDIKLFIKDLY